MKVIVDAVIIESLDITERVRIEVTAEKYPKVIKALRYQRDYIINYFKKLKNDGEIKSIFRPKNKKIQKKLNNLIECKRIINKTIKKLIQIYK